MVHAYLLSFGFKNGLSKITKNLKKIQNIFLNLIKYASLRNALVRSL